MQEYVVIMLCSTVLLIFGVLNAPCRAAGLTAFRVAYLLLCVAVLSQFNWRASVEVCINAGAGIMAVMPALLVREKDKGSGVLSVVVLFALMSVLLGRTGWFWGTDNGLLWGVIGGLPAVLFSESPCNALFCAGTIPVFAKVIEAFYQMASTGYASLEITTVTLTAQLAALFIAVAVLYMSQAAKALYKAE